MTKNILGEQITEFIRVLGSTAGRYNIVMNYQALVTTAYNPGAIDPSLFGTTFDVFYQSPDMAKIEAWDWNSRLRFRNFLADSHFSENESPPETDITHLSGAFLTGLQSEQNVLVPPFNPDFNPFGKSTMFTLSSIKITCTLVKNDSGIDSDSDSSDSGDCPKSGKSPVSDAY